MGNIYMNPVFMFQIYSNQDWTDGSGLITLKAPTVVLFDESGKFDSFGYDVRIFFLQY